MSCGNCYSQGYYLRREISLAYATILNEEAADSLESPREPPMDEITPFSQVKWA